MHEPSEFSILQGEEDARHGRKASAPETRKGRQPRHLTTGARSQETAAQDQECIHDSHEFGTFDNVTGACGVCGKAANQVKASAPETKHDLSVASKDCPERHRLSGAPATENEWCPICRNFCLPPEPK
jgi:bacterioferritin-associated ferredoxin